ncbi:MAG: AraC family transcriptional regulator [Eubacterium sp.]|nr:AraC family transcriptional regulator [Eubacterium sp.]
MKQYDIISKNEKRNIFFNCIPFCIEKLQLSNSDHIHIHEFSQLTIVTGGHGKIIVNNYEKNIMEGCVYVINSFTPHHLKEIDRLEIINVLFHANDLMAYAGTLKENEGFQSLFVLQAALNERMDLTNVLHLGYDELFYLSEICNHLLEETEKSESGYEIMVQSYFMVLITYLSRVYKKNGVSDLQKHKSQKHLTHQVVSYLENHYTEPLIIEDLAAMACLSERQFRRLFTEQYGLSPKQYCLNLRLKESCYLLKTTELSIREISSKTGFEDANYFSRQFKKHTGFTPKEYRNLKTY